MADIMSLGNIEDMRRRKLVGVINQISGLVLAFGAAVREGDGELAIDLLDRIDLDIVEGEKIAKAIRGAQPRIDSAIRGEVREKIQKKHEPALELADAFANASSEIQALCLHGHCSPLNDWKRFKEIDDGLRHWVGNMAVVANVPSVTVTAPCG